MPIQKVITGGQTGVDQAALQAAIDCGLGIGGWCSPGRACEGGVVPRRFPLKETPEERSPHAPDIPRSLRSEWNVRDADAVLFFVPDIRDSKDPGTQWALDCTQLYKKPYLLAELVDPDTLSRARRWLSDYKPSVLSIGGPSENTCPGIYIATYQFLCILFELSQ